MDEERIGCEFCYYEYFDGKAYPCSMCIRGEERTDKFEPKDRHTKQTKQADRTPFDPLVEMDIKRAVEERLRQPERNEQMAKEISIGDALKALSDAPTIDRPRGKWILIFNDPLRADFKCSKCLKLNSIATRYCPNCGANMEGENDVI